MKTYQLKTLRVLRRSVAQPSRRHYLASVLCSLSAWALIIEHASGASYGQGLFRSPSTVIVALLTLSVLGGSGRLLIQIRKNVREASEFTKIRAEMMRNYLSTVC